MNQILSSTFLNKVFSNLSYKGIVAGVLYKAICIATLPLVTISLITFPPYTWVFFTLGAAILLNIYIYFLVKSLFTISLDIAVAVFLTKAIIYILFLLFSLSFDLYSIDNINLIFLLFGLEDGFIFITPENYLYNYNPNNTTSNNPQPNGQNPQNGPNTGVAGINSNSSSNPDESSFFPPETEFHRLARDLTADVNRIIVERAELQERYPQILQSLSVTIGQLDIGATSIRGNLIRKFADEYLASNSRDVDVVIFCNKVKTPTIRTAVIYNCSHMPRHNIFGSKILDAIANHKSKN